MAILAPSVHEVTTRDDSTAPRQSVSAPRITDRFDIGRTTKRAAIGPETNRPLVTTGVEPNGEGKAQVRELTTRQRAGRRQEVMWKITEDKNLAGCHRWTRGGEVGLSYSNGGTSEFVGLQNTRSRWGSPLAELEVMRDRRTELALAVKNWLAGGGSIIMAVGTVRHKRSQPLAQVLGGVQSAYDATVNTPKWRKGDREHYGITHVFTDYEHTWSPANGHHPHKNMLLFVGKALSPLELEALGDSMFGRWSAGAVKAGLEAPLRERGVKLEQVTTWGAGAAKAAVYLAKGMAAEFTGAATKEAYAESLTAFQILDTLADQRDADGCMDPRLVAVYREYERNFKGLRSSWSRGAKKALEVDHITAEQREELAEELAALTGEEREERPEREERFIVAGIPRSEWSKISADMQARERVLEAVEGARSRAEAQRNALVMLAEFGVVGVPRMVSMEGLDLDSVLPSSLEALSRDLRKAVAA